MARGEDLVKVGSVDSEQERFAKLQEFRRRVLTDHTCGMFNDVDQLVTKADGAPSDPRATFELRGRPTPAPKAPGPLLAVPANPQRRRSQRDDYWRDAA